MKSSLVLVLLLLVAACLAEGETAEKEENKDVEIKENQEQDTAATDVQKPKNPIYPILAKNKGLKPVGIMLKDADGSSAVLTLMEGFIVGIATEFNIEPKECVDGLESIWYDIEDAVNSVEGGFTKDNIKTALVKLAQATNGFVHALDSCGLASLAEQIAEVAIEMESGYGEIAESVKIVVHSVDIYDDITDIFDGFRENNYWEVGKSLGMLVRTFLD